MCLGLRFKKLLFDLLVKKEEKNIFSEIKTYLKKEIYI